ncbi:MAG: DUF4199 domain-containing protein [Paludibacteraceae bacterium]|nr:DUF4199 domain-containing protein [Paludibacteraceae bacterium]
MEKFELRMLSTRQAMKYGVWFGLFLVLKFVLEIMVQGNAGIFLSGFLTVMVPFVAYWLTLRFKFMTNDEGVGFGTLYRFCIYLFFFASMFLAVSEFVYYQYINPDYIAEQLETLFAFLEKYNDSASATTVTNLKAQLDEVGVPSASAVAVQTLWIYIFLGLILGLPIAAIAKNKR